MERLSITQHSDNDGNLEIRGRLDLLKTIRLDPYLANRYFESCPGVIVAAKERIRQEFAHDLYGEVHELGRELLCAAQNIMRIDHYLSFSDSEKVRELCLKLMNFGMEKSE